MWETEAEEKEIRGTTMVIKLKDESITRNLIKKPEKLWRLLIANKFDSEMSSIPRYNYREHKLIINIKDWRKVPELANEIELGIQETGYWLEEFYCSIHTQPIKK